MDDRVAADEHAVSRFSRWFTLIALAAVGAAILAGLATQLGDHVLRNVPYNGDDPAPAMNALVHGRVGLAVREQPLMGLFSILLRLPFAALAIVLHGGQMLAYRFGIFPCALAVGIVAVVVGALARERGRSTWAAAVMASLLLINPMTFDAIRWGHPEELLTAALCLGAVLAAVSERPLLAGVLLGLALGTKEWALVAAVPVLLGLRAGRARTGIVAAAVAAPLALAMPLADPAVFLRAARNVGDYHLLSPVTWWALVADVHRVTVHVDGRTVTTYIDHIPFRLTRSDLSWLIPAVTPLLGLLFARRGGERRSSDAIALLALMLLLRGTLDPFGTLYYYLPFFMALLAWEVLARPGLPAVTLISGSGLWFVFQSHMWQLLDFPRTPVTALFTVLTAGVALYLGLRTVYNGVPYRSLRARWTS